MHALTVRWSLADAPEGVEEALATYVADTSHVSYRFDLATPGGSYVAEQQAYYRGTDVIEHLRVMCSGFRPR